jgi:hypothetical protein
MPEPGQLRVISDLALAKKLLEAQRQGHQAGDSWHLPRWNYRSSFDRACACLVALAYPAPEWNLAYNRLR